MLELFSPFHLWKEAPHALGQLGLYATHAVWFLLFAIAVEAAVASAERFLERITGLALLWVQVRLFVYLLAVYGLSLLAMHLFLTYGVNLEMPVERLALILGLAILPRVYVVFGLVPYLGRTFHRLLDIWTVVLLFRALTLGLEAQAWVIMASGCVGLATFLSVRQWLRHILQGTREEPGPAVPSGIV